MLVKFRVTDLLLFSVGSVECAVGMTEKEQKAPDSKDAVNPHIPAFISQSPWYLSGGSGLEHQKGKEKVEVPKTWYVRGVKGTTATKFRKGACTNCGALTHTAKNCCERPRQVGAKYTGQGIKADEIIQEVQLDYEGKRDRWNGYDPSRTFQAQLREFNLSEAERKAMKREQEKAAALLDAFQTEPDPAAKRFPHQREGEEPKEGGDLVSDSDSEAEEKEKEDYHTEGGPIVGVKKDPRTRTTIRNLRIREDVAKYLKNLDPNSAPYDPKSRSMRDVPKGPTEEWTRPASRTAYNREAWAHSGTFEDSQDPKVPEQPPSTSTETDSEVSRRAMEALYGAQGTGRVRVEESSDYLEFSPDGFARPPPAAAVLSRYLENVWPLNHRAVWGSWWSQGLWGYACCHSTIRSSYCTGKAGIVASQSSHPPPLVDSSEPSPQEVPTLPRGKRAIPRGRDGEMTAEEFEEFQRKRQRPDDPMAKP